MRALIVVMALLLAGCQTRIVKEPVEVLIPVATQCPAPPEMEPVIPMTKQLKPGDEAQPGYVAQVYRATIIQLLGEIQRRDTILDAFRQQ